MLELPPNNKDRLTLYYALHALNHDKRYQVVLRWFEESFVRWANQAIDMDGGPALYRLQGNQKFVDVFLGYVKASSGEIDKLEQYLKEPRPG